MANGPEKNEKLPQAIVAIDGAAIRRIREAKKLTQLYVSSVVGVTTDTISRWENNRYPTIKRDNAEKVAAALEVPLEEILQPEPSADEQPSEPALPTRTRRTIGMVLALVVVGLAALAGYLVWHGSGGTIIATRTIPPFGAPGQIIPVKITVSRSDGKRGGIIVKERLPAGWQFVSANPPLTGEATRRELKWLVPGGSGPLTIRYTLLVPRESPLQIQVELGGEVVGMTRGASRTKPTGGNGTVTVAGIHWADTNGDGRIDDTEIMPAYDLTEEMKGLGLDWKTIEGIWNAGGYTWNGGSKVFEVAK